MAQPERVRLPARSTRGKRVSELVGEDLDADEEFWNQKAFQEEAEDVEFALEGEVEEDVFDSDFDDDEPDNEEEEAGTEVKEKPTKRRLLPPGTKKKPKKTTKSAKKGVAGKKTSTEKGRTSERAEVEAMGDGAEGGKGKSKAGKRSGVGKSRQRRELALLGVGRGKREAEEVGGGEEREWGETGEEGEDLIGDATVDLTEENWGAGGGREGGGREGGGMERRKSRRTAVVVRDMERQMLRAAREGAPKAVRKRKEGERRWTQEEMLLEAAQTGTVRFGGVWCGYEGWGLGTTLGIQLERRPGCSSGGEGHGEAAAEGCEGGRAQGSEEEEGGREAVDTGGNAAGSSADRGSEGCEGEGAQGCEEEEGGRAAVDTGVDASRSSTDRCTQVKKFFHGCGDAESCKAVRKRKESERRWTQEQMLWRLHTQVKCGSVQWEILNREALAVMLAREEEVKRKAVVEKASFGGPQIRFHSKDGKNTLEFTKVAAVPPEINAMAPPYPAKPTCVITGLPANFFQHCGCGSYSTNNPPTSKPFSGMFCCCDLTFQIVFENSQKHPAPTSKPFSIMFCCCDFDFLGTKTHSQASRTPLSRPSRSSGKCGRRSRPQRRGCGKRQRRRRERGPRQVWEERQHPRRDMGHSMGLNMVHMLLNMDCLTMIDN
ncbi:unnamed protein product [Closterium sp. NIES-53]